MYNFLDFKLLPKVITTKPCMDNYEVENLISDDFLAKSRGFVAYSVVKPPVDVIFELICPVNIHYLVITTNLNNQKYTTIEILARNGNRNFTTIGIEKFNTTGVVFCNNRNYSINHLPLNIDKSYCVSFFKHNCCNSYATASFITVRILRTEGSVPCLGKVEIFGTPSRICSSKTIDTINRLMQKQLPSCATATNDVQKNNFKAVKDWEIPAEFKDMLTYEVMSLPYTLPSGNTVDKSTLDKCAGNNASYGRLPSDPFTGSQFNNVHKPIFNAALKQRIDIFLLQYSDKSETFNVGRTVGTDKIIETGNQNETLGLKHFEQFAAQNNENDNNQNTEIEMQDHEQILNQAIQRTLKSKGFVCYTRDVTAINNLSCCVSCKIAENLYKLPCNDLYCKSCLLSLMQDLQCGKCKKKFYKKDPVKFHP